MKSTPYVFHSIWPRLGSQGWVDLRQPIMWFLCVRSDPQSKITLKYVYSFCFGGWLIFNKA